MADAGAQAHVAVRAVVFDVGYTLIDEARDWAEWARAIDVTPERLMAELRGVIARGEHHRTVFARLRPAFDLERALRDREREGARNSWREEDLYPDARPTLRALKHAGVQVGLAGNQPPEALAALQALDLGVDWIANSAQLGVEKPAPEFFAAIAARCGEPAEAIAYVGDRLDNDVLPAQRAGMRGVFLVRGPWGEAHARRDDARMAHVCIDALSALPRALGLSRR